MGTSPTKAADNIYCRCRKEAAKFNDKLNSREGASELLGCSSSTLADYELGITKTVPVDSVVRMADLYNAPELKNYYCTNECPIGKTCVDKIEIEEFDRTVIKILSSLRAVESLKDRLLRISDDGKVDDSERMEFDDILNSLKHISYSSQELSLWAEKNLKRGD